MKILNLKQDEIIKIKKLIHEIRCNYDCAINSVFLNKASLLAGDIPKRIREFLLEYKNDEMGEGLCLIKGFPIDDNKIGQTPSHWDYKGSDSPVLETDFLFVLYSSILGEAFGWSTQQNGKLIHDVLPIKGHENEQLGSSSLELLTWHIEDAFHEYRADYMGLYCLRNHDQVPTTYASIRDVDLNKIDKEILFQKRFKIKPDESHLSKNNKIKNLDFNYIESLNCNDVHISILFGNPNYPYLRLDPYFMDELENDKKGQKALNQIVKVIDSQINDLILTQGDFCFIDNYRVVHGRKPFKASFNGKDRWLKRINITRDIRKSSNSRELPYGRNIRQPL